MSVVNSTMGNIAHCDVMVVGAGFGGTYAVYKFRKLGLNVKCFEAGSDFGGVWYWNRYPGARVDSEWPFYQLSIPEVYEGWDFNERFPDHRELRRYFNHLDKVLDIRRDCQFDAKVNSCVWDPSKKHWTVKTEAGHIAICKYLFLASGLLHRRHYPDFPGLTDFEGLVHHSGFWPEDLSVAGKRVAVIGAGATSVQIVSSLAKEAGHLTMFMRRPSFCLPMMQRHITKEEQDQLRCFYHSFFKVGRQSFAGFPAKRNAAKTFDVSAEEREETWEKAWQSGGFHFLLKQYADSMSDQKSNKAMYDFWRKKVLQRLKNPEKQRLMAPEEPPYPIGTKRAPLEGDYYEMLDQDNVEIVQLNEIPIKTFNKTGMLMEDGKQRDFDIVVLATGFDSFSGSVSMMGLKNTNGEDIKDIWDKNGIATYLGMFIHGFPNLAMIYTPQSPTAFSNGPTILEAQVDMIIDQITKAREEGIDVFECEKSAQDEWVGLVEYMVKNTLYPLTNSWWTGGNIPGKKVQMLTYAAGIETYEAQCRGKMAGWEGFVTTKSAE